MMPPVVPAQAEPPAYAYASGSFSVRRGLLLPVYELRQAASGRTEALLALLNRGVYAPVAVDLSPTEALARVEASWQAFVSQASRDLPEGFLPYVVAALDEKEYAKAGLAKALLGDTLGVADERSDEYAAYCLRLRGSRYSGQVLAETVFGSALADGLKAAEQGASCSDAQTVFEFSFESTLEQLARKYAHPSVLVYIRGLRDLMIAGHALKAKLRSGAGVGVAVDRLLPFLEPQVRDALSAAITRVQGISWDNLQPSDLVPEASMVVLPVDRRYTPEERIGLLEDALDSWIVDRTQATASEPYGVTVVFSYLMDFRREVRLLRRLLKAAASRDVRAASAGSTR